MAPLLAVRARRRPDKGPALLHGPVVHYAAGHSEGDCGVGRRPIYSYAYQLITPLPPSTATCSMPFPHHYSYWKLTAFPPGSTFYSLQEGCAANPDGGSCIPGVSCQPFPSPSMQFYMMSQSEDDPATFVAIHTQ